MNEHFEAADPAKRKRVIAAACKEFARHGLKRASTNRIVEEAGIGKGMLFHYFGSKQGLYDYLLEYSIEFVNSYYSMIKKPDINLDFIEKYRVASEIKLGAYIDSPHVLEFLSRAYLHEDPDVDDEIKEKMATLETMRREIFELLATNPNTSKFREDIPEERLIKFVRWIMDGYTSEMLAIARSTENFADVDLLPYWEKFDVYLDDLKKILYKQDVVL